MKVYFAAFAAALAFTPAHAQTIDCRSPKTGTEIRLCAQSESERADSDVNRVLAEFVAFAAQPELKAILQSSQEIWLKYRDEACAVDAFQWKGGSGYGAAFNSCRITLAKERAKHLRATLDWLKKL